MSIFPPLNVRCPVDYPNRAKRRTRPPYLFCLDCVAYLLCLLFMACLVSLNYLVIVVVIF